MSVYYEFYVGYTTNDNKFHAYGPYDKFGKLTNLFFRSGGYINGLNHDFAKIDDDMLDDDLKNLFGYKDYSNNMHYDMYYLDVNDLPDTEYVISGYFPMDEVIMDIEDKDGSYDKCFTERYSNTEYSIRLQKAIIDKDEEELKRLKKFVFYSYPDYNSKNYLAYQLSTYILWDGLFSEQNIKDSVKENTGEEVKDIVFLMHIS